MIRRRTVLTLAALGAVPALAAAQTSTVPYVPPTQGTATGVAWGTVDLGTCSVATGTAIVNGAFAGCNNSGIGSPAFATAAFGSIWTAANGGYGGGSTTYLQAIDPTTSQALPGTMITGIDAPQAGVQGGSYLWIAGATAELGNGKSATVVAGVDSTGTVRKRFTSSARAVAGMGQSVAYGAGRVWVGDTTNRIYALSPSTGRLQRTIRTPNTRGLAVAGRTLWATSATGRTVRVFNTATGAQRAVFKVLGSPNAVVAASGSVWVFSQRYLYRYNPRTLKQVGRYSAPLSQSGWVGAVAGPGGIWASNYVAQVVRFNTGTRTFDLNTTWSNGNVAGSVGSAGGAVWVANGGISPSPVGHSVTRFTPTP